MSIKFQKESISAVKDEVMPLLLQHWEEIALNKAAVPLDPRWDMYEVLEEKGNFLAVTARCDNKIIGYAAYFITLNFHYKSLIVGESDIFYLAKPYRKGMTGVRLLQAAENELLSSGVNFIVNKTKIHFRNENNADVGGLFTHLGYKHIENIYSKLVVQNGSNGSDSSSSR